MKISTTFLTIIATIATTTGVVSGAGAGSPGGPGSKGGVAGSANDKDLPKLRVGILKRATPSDCKRKAIVGDIVQVDYTGKLADGTIFDSSLKAGRDPLEFALGLGQVIPGWDKGILGMCIGEKRKLVIPPHLAYGSAGAGNVIPPEATLTFITELKGIKGYTPEEDNEDEDVKNPTEEGVESAEPETKLEKKEEQKVDGEDEEKEEKAPEVKSEETEAEKKIDETKDTESSAQPEPEVEEPTGADADEEAAEEAAAAEDEDEEDDDEEENDEDEEDEEEEEEEVKTAKKPVPNEDL